MKKYVAYLEVQKITVEYIDCTDKLSDIRKLIPFLANQNITALYFADVVDDWLYRRLVAGSGKYNIKLEQLPTPNFLNTTEAVKTFFDEKKNYFQTAFYIEQRRQRHILVDAGNQPYGGKWSFDEDNRKKYPKGEKPPSVNFAAEDNYSKEAKNYVAKYFPQNYGNTEKFIYPTDHQGAEKWLDEFVETRFEKFGIYQDAIAANENFLHHSVLTPMLNTGLLDPQQIIDKALAAASTKNIPLNSAEGFIRQIIGWREFMKVVYVREGRVQRTKNYWGFKRKIPKNFWTGDTGIFPVDTVIKKVLQTGYSHHIERLMVMGNFMLLCEFDPGQVYRWFMEMYIDAYDWVMVPNVYGMSQAADGCIMITKPYISGSNYLLKMSNYPKGWWTKIWDSLFWRFMHVHRNFLLKNERIGMLLKTFDNMPGEKRKMHLDNAEGYLETLDAKIIQYE